MSFSEPFDRGAQSNGLSSANGRTASSAPVYTEEDEISLHEIVSILWKGRWIIVGCFAVVLGLAALYTFAKAPEYEASSMLYIDNQQSTPQLGEMLGLEAMGNRNILNEIEILKSRAIANGVAEALQDIRFVPGTDQPLTVLETDEDDEPLTTMDIANRLRQNYVQVRPVSREVDLIDVVATSTVPDEAALIANLFAQEFLEYNRTSSRARMAASREFLTDVSGRYADSLQMSEDRLMSFLDQERLVAPDEEAKQLLEQVSELNRLQYETQIELGTAQTELHGLEAEVERIRPDLAERISSGNNAVIDQLTARIAEKEVEIEELYARNPDLRESPERSTALTRLQREVEALRDRLNDRSEQLVQSVMASGGGVTLDEQGRGGSSSQMGLLQSLLRQITEKRIAVNALEARQNVVQSELQDYMGRLNALPRKEIVLNRMQRTLETRQQLYLTLIEKLQEARIAEQSELGYVDVIDEAVEPRDPVRPRVPLNLALGAVLGLMLGVGFAFMRNAFDNKVRDPESLRKHGVGVAGVVPDLQSIIQSDFGGEERVEVDGHEYSTGIITLLNPLSPASESYRRLRTNLRFSRPDGDVDVIMVTSGSPSEGKSLTSANLAVAMAQTGQRTLLLDADLRRSRVHHMLDLPREPGLVELVFDEYGGHMGRFATDVDDLYVMPAGSRAPNPAEIIGSERMEALMRRLRQEFDSIVIDTPPVLAVPDSLVISRLADVTVLVVRAGQTHWHALDRTKEALHDVGTSKPLVVLNHFDPKQASYGYGYGYGYDYAEYYGEQQPVART